MTESDGATQPHRGARIAPRDHLVIMAGLALAAGFTEAAVLFFRRFVQHGFMWASLDVAWMAPVSYVSLLAVPALVLFVIARRRPDGRALFLTVMVGVFVCLAALLDLLLGNRIAAPALLVLALGAAVRMARAAYDRPEVLTGFAQRATTLMAALLGVVAAVFVFGAAAGEHRRLAELPDAPSASSNVLLLILDTVRASSLGLYGYARPTTPRLEEWADRGVTFERAIAPAPWTLPAHASMFTGSPAHRLAAGWLHPLPDERLTLAEAFRQGGYLTAGFTANFYYTTRETGLSQGFDHYEARTLSLQQMLLSSNLGQKMFEKIRGYSVEERLSDRHNAGEINAAALEWLDARDETRPFFAFLNYFDAHRPVYAPDSVLAQFDDDRPRVDRYDASIAYLDAQIDELLTELESRDLLDNTIVVITSDHGEMLGEHDLRGHGHSLYVPLLHVPLVVLGPDVPHGERVAGSVGLQDLPATLLELTGVKADPGLPGMSLSRHWDPAATDVQRPVVASVEPGINAPASHPSSRGTMYSLTTGQFHYIVDSDGHEELYDLQKDPTGETDIAATAVGRARLPALRRAFEQAVPEARLKDRLVTPLRAADSLGSAASSGSGGDDVTAGRPESPPESA